VDFVTKNVSWRKYKGTITHPVNGLYLNGIHNRYVDYKVYDELNRQILNIYLKKDKEKKLKIQMIDSSFIANKNGSVFPYLYFALQNKILGTLGWKT